MGQNHTPVCCVRRHPKLPKVQAGVRDEVNRRQEAEDLLRDVAYVLHLTRKVKQSILEGAGV